MVMKMLSWNVNGIRAALKKGFLDFLKDEKPDFLCLQETKAQPEQVDLDVPGYEQFWNSAEKKGYSGTLILAKKEPEKVVLGIGKTINDNEGRVITLEYPDFHLITVYTPNSARGLTRLDYRMEWDKEFLKFIKRMNKKKPVIFCGDTNVAHEEIDLANPKTNRKNAGFTDQEREGFTKILKAGFIDSFREFKKEGGHYSWWSNMNNARARNIGWRLDYFVLAQELRPRLKDAFILKDVMGSDHCPVGITFK